MPELPEVETVAAGLRAGLAGLRIERVELNHPSLFSGDPQQLLQLEEGRFTTIERAGKYLLMQVSHPKGKWTLMVHLGMSGKLLLLPAATPLERHSHLVLSLETDRQLRLIDPRRFGRVALANTTGLDRAETLKALGVASGAEPFEVTPDEFLRLFSRRDAPIKNLLLNQTLLRGLGNIYADESLFRAGIHPQARRVSRPRLLRLREQVQAVLGEAIAAGGSSINDYVHSDGERGWFQVQHRVYGRTDQACVACGTPVRRLVLAGRSAHFCPRCQRR